MCIMGKLHNAHTCYPCVMQYRNDVYFLVQWMVHSLYALKKVLQRLCLRRTIKLLIYCEYKGHIKVLEARF